MVAVWWLADTVAKVQGRPDPQTLLSTVHERRCTQPSCRWNLAVPSTRATYSHVHNGFALYKTFFFQTNVFQEMGKTLRFRKIYLIIYNLNQIRTKLCCFDPPSIKYIFFHFAPSKRNCVILVWYYFPKVKHMFRINLLVSIRIYNEWIVNFGYIGYFVWTFFFLFTTIQKHLSSDPGKRLQLLFKP